MKLHLWGGLGNLQYAITEDYIRSEFLWKRAYSTRFQMQQKAI